MQVLRSLCVEVSANKYGISIIHELVFGSKTLFCITLLLHHCEKLIAYTSTAEPFADSAGLFTKNTPHVDSGTRLRRVLLFRERRNVLDCSWGGFRSLKRTKIYMCDEFSPTKSLR